jgi:hypothetical protein
VLRPRLNRMRRESKCEQSMAITGGSVIRTLLLAVALSGTVTARAGIAQEADLSAHKLPPRHELGGNAIMFGVAGRRQAHWLHSSEIPAAVQRNAIGMAVAPSSFPQRPRVGPFGFSPPTRLPSAAGRPPYVHSGLGGPGFLGANLGPGRSFENRGTINGSGVIRPGLTTSATGGPSKSAIGINGTTVFPKH